MLCAFQIITVFVRIYDLYSGSFRNWKVIPLEPGHHGIGESVLVNNQLIILPSMQYVWDVYDDIQSVDIRTGNITELPPLKRPWTCMSVVAFKHEIYFSGGEDYRVELGRVRPLMQSASNFFEK